MINFLFSSLPYSVRVLKNSSLPTFCPLMLAPYFDVICSTSNPCMYNQASVSVLVRIEKMLAVDWPATRILGLITVMSSIISLRLSASTSWALYLSLTLSVSNGITSGGNIEPPSISSCAVVCSNVPPNTEPLHIPLTPLTLFLPLDTLGVAVKKNLRVLGLCDSCSIGIKKFLAVQLCDSSK